MTRVEIRRRTRLENALTAASSRVTGSRSFRSRSVGITGKEDWQDKAWLYFRLVSELRYYAEWRAASMSRVRLVASELDSEGKPTGSIADDNPDAEKVRKIVADIAGGAVGQSKMLLRGGLLVSVPGECWVAMIVRAPVDKDAEDILATLGELANYEEWHVLARSQISSTGRDVKLKLRDGSTHVFNPDTDIMFRVWDENPEDPTQATSPVFSNMVSLNEIVRASATIDNAGKSRLIGNGMIFMPKQASLPGHTTPKAKPLGAATDGPEPPPQWVGGQTTQDLQDLLFDVATTAIGDPDSLAALLPILVGIDGDQVKNVQWLRPSSEVPETALKTREAAMRRLAIGLFITPERLLGQMGEANHWVSWSMGDDDVRTHITPPVDLFADALTTNVFKPKLVADGIDPSKYVIWHDVSALTQDPDKSDEALDAHDRGAIGSQALREHLGLDGTDGYDLTEKDEWLRLAFDKITVDPSVNLPVFLPLLKELLGAQGEFLPDAVAPPAIESGTPPDEPDNATTPESEPDTEGEPADENDPEASLNAAAYTVTRMCVTRALELANKRQRTRQNVAAFAGIPLIDAHIRLGAVLREDVDRLIDGWDLGVEPYDLAALGFNPDRFRRMIVDTAAYALTNGCTWQFLDARMVDAMNVKAIV